MKRCCHCGEAKDDGAFWRKSNRPDGLQDGCKDCQRQKQAARTKTDQWKATAKAWRMANPEAIDGYRTPQRGAEYNAKWRLANPERWKEIQAKSRRNQAANLTDMYVKRCITRGKFSLTDIPAEMIEAKRQHMRVKSLLKEQKK